MKTINLKEAYKFLKDSDGIIVSGYAISEDLLVNPTLSDLDGFDDNEFLYIFWTEDDERYSLKFCEGDNREVMVTGSSIFLYDTDSNDEDDHTKITILTKKHLE